MSDEWNFHDSFESAIRENAGHLGVLGALNAASQRTEQLRLLEASLSQQAEIARTEAQRLEIESQRLELERLKQQSAKDEKEAVRLLRVMMADVGAEFDNLETRDDSKDSPQGLRRDYAMAVLMSKLELVRSRSGSLSDLNDLKELLRLENLAQDLVSKHFPGGHPLEVTRAKWAELQAWMQGVERIGMQVKQICASVPDPTAVQLPSRAVLAALQVKMEGFATQLKFDLNQHASSLPNQAAWEGILLDELAEQARLEDLSIGKNPIRAKVFTNCWHQVTVTSPFLLDVQTAIRELQLWKNEAAEHEYALQELLVQVEEGRLNDAKRSAIKIGRVRFDNLDYSPVSDLGKLEQTLVILKTAKWRYVPLKVAELRREFPKAGSKSDLGQVLKAALARAARGKKVKETKVLVGVATACCIAILFIYFQAEETLEAAENREALRSLMGDGQLGSVLPVRLPGGVMMEMVTANGFWLGKTEVTQEQWEVVMGDNPSGFKGKERPVSEVKSKDAMRFVEKLNESRLLPDGWKFKLYTIQSQYPKDMLRVAAVSTGR